jgi:multicomponent K+:H+ antiporter subunit E
VVVPLDVRLPEAITVLAGTITMTPGTVSADLSADHRSLLVHCLEADTPEETIATIKSRYESRLKRIFE